MSRPTIAILEGNALDRLAELPSESIQCVVTSPPYWGLRDYGVEGQIGLEETFDEYIDELVEIFHEVRRLLREDGTLWLNLGDTYHGGGGGNYGNGISSKQGGQHLTNVRNRLDLTRFGVKPKDLIGIPWRVAIALQADEWYLRSDIIWHKPNPMPESVTDRPTKAHEYVFLMTKSPRYFYDLDAVRESGGRNLRTVWTIPTQPYTEAHFATFPELLAERCIKAGTKTGDVVLDPFAGSGTTGVVARRLGRSCILIELKPEYIGLIKKRIDYGDESLDAFLG